MVDKVLVGGRGIRQLQALSRELRDAQNKGIRRELGKAFTRAVRAPKQQARVNALTRLPRRGGLAARVAASPIRTRNRIASRNPSLSVIVNSRDNIANMDKGRLKHPVFGRDQWVTQRVRPGWWSDAWRSAGPEAKREVAAAMRDIQRKISEGTR